jgi:arylsulfatase A-like enzyme
MESGEEVLPVALAGSTGKGSGGLVSPCSFLDPHTPYRAPEAFGNPFADEPLPDWLTDPAVLERHMAMTGPHTALDVSMYDDKESPQYPRQPGKVTDMAGMRRIIDGYDCGIRYADQLIGQIFDRLADQGILDDVAVIITADHGENFGELAFTRNTRRPIRRPAGSPLSSAGRTARRPDRPALHYNIDLVPTVADLLNLSHAASWDGRSFASTLQTAG